MVNINLVCQSVPKEPLQARVSRGAVATVITACGFVTLIFSDRTVIGYIVATVITACGFVTDLNDDREMRKYIRCNSDYRLRFCNSDKHCQHNVFDKCCNSDYRLRFCNEY